MRKKLLESKKSSNQGMLTGALLGILFYSFTGNMAAVILGLLIGLILDRKNKEQQ